MINSADDILVFGKDLDDHNLRLKKIHDRLLEKGLTLNKNKYIFAVKEIEFLRNKQVRLPVNAIKS